MKTQHIKTYGMQQKQTSDGRFIVMETHLKKEVRSQINKLTLYLKKLGKEQTKPKARLEHK